MAGFQAPPSGWFWAPLDTGWGDVGTAIPRGEAPATLAEDAQFAIARRIPLAPETVVSFLLAPISRRA